MTPMAHLVVRLPDNAPHLAQTEEYCLVTIDRCERLIRLQSYAEIYRVPGLYERLISEMLQCRSPQVVTTMLDVASKHAGSSLADLVVLDVGAGNGMVGAELQRSGVSRLLGIDIEPAAAEAARRDRPQVYARYYVEDLTRLSPQTRAALEAEPINAMTCISAMGHNHLPVPAFAAAYALVAMDGWVVFNLNAELLRNPPDRSLAALIITLCERAVLDVVAEQTYQHRLAVNGTPIMYTAMVGRKRAPIPADLTTP